MKKGLTPGRVNRCFGILLAILLAVAAFLFWLGYIEKLGLILVVITIFIAGVLCTFGTRIAQRDGFLDGYVRAKDGLKKKKE